MQHNGRHIALLIVFWICSSVALTGQSTGAFARLGFGARGMSMGNALVADGTGNASAYYNPALAPLVSDQAIDAGFGVLSHDRVLQHLQFSVPLKPMAGFTAGLIRAAVTGIEGRDASGYFTEEYKTEEYALFFDFGLKFSSRFSLGIGVRYYRNDLLPTIEPASSLGLNAGLLIRPTDFLSIGFAIDDLAAAYSWDTSTAFGEDGRKTTDRFPIRIRGGASMQLFDGSANLSVEVESLVDRAEAIESEVILVDMSPTAVSRWERINDQQTWIRAGVEWWPIEILAIRAGIDRIGSTAVDGIKPSFGFAFQQDLGELGANFDYALVKEPYGFNFMHILGVTFEL